MTDASGRSKCSVTAARPIVLVHFVSWPYAVMVPLNGPAGPFSGTITAYGHETKWTSTIGRAAVTEHFERPEASVIVRADGPIEGVEYTPTWASCTFHAGT